MVPPFGTPVARDEPLMAFGRCRSSETHRSRTTRKSFGPKNCRRVEASKSFRKKKNSADHDWDEMSADQHLHLQNNDELIPKFRRLLGIDCQATISPIRLGVTYQRWSLNGCTDTLIVQNASNHSSRNNDHFYYWSRCRFFKEKARLFQK